MSQPFEVLAGPLTLFYAPKGTAFPAIDATPGEDWVLVGKSGEKNYDDDGVTVTHAQSINTPRGSGSTGPIKAFRSEEDLQIEVTIWDMTLEAYALALNSNAVTSVAAGVGTAGYKHMRLYRGGDVATMALLARGKSAYAAGLNMQFEVPYCFISGDPEPQFTKGDPAGLLLQFSALADFDASSGMEFGRLVMGHQEPLE